MALVSLQDVGVSFGGQHHVIGYLKDFLFSPDRARSPVRILSGGERNRLLLARLFSRPSNVLVLDEPTNDLDMETLELLEERLALEETYARWQELESVREGESEADR
jgi:ABC transport system ATP-binding/permease protein